MGALDEGFLHLRVHYQVYVALAVAELRILEAVVYGTVGIRLHDGQHAQGLAQDGEFLGVDGELAGLGVEGKALDTHDITDVQQLLEHSVVQGLVFSGANLVPFHIHLDTAFAVLQFHKGSGAHDAAAHDPAGDADILEIVFLFLIAGGNGRSAGIHGIQRCGVGVDAQLAQLAKGFPPSELLLVQLIICHSQ